jgi:pimeloyl-ACP methyl ester carboxylesterase
LRGVSKISSAKPTVGIDQRVETIRRHWKRNLSHSQVCRRETMSEQRRASNGIHYRIEGTGEPLLLLHGLMVRGHMYDPLVEHLRDRYRMLIPDLRGHGSSGGVAGPYDVPSLAGDLDCVLAEAGFERSVVVGYSHGGAVAQQFARMQPQRVSKLVLACTYACNVATTRERIEAGVLVSLLSVVDPGTLGKLILWLSQLQANQGAALTREQLEWMQALMAGNSRAPMREAAKGLISFDSRPWLDSIRIPTLVVAGARDAGVPRHHYDMLVNGIPDAVGYLIEDAGHTLAWTHTRQFAEFLRNHT